ncbi:hypothetical protein BDR26DRAFT_498941 [Obelidium mucronatum]|nr:hypothetical protein BDR26DRAFT_498941 [Obelidium mucronatum]
MKRVYSSTGFINQPPPMFCGTAISLFDLYMMVTAKGGYDKIDLEAWREIGSNLLLSQIPAPSARVLKAIYHQYLLNFERTVNFTQLIQQAKPDMLRIERAPEPAPKKKKEAKEHALPQTQVLPPMAHLYKPAHPLLEIADSPGDLEVDDSSDPNQDYDVEAILGHAIDKVQKKTMYYVKWLGYANNLNQWIPEGNFTGDVLLAEYKKRISDRKKADAAKAAAVGTSRFPKTKTKSCAS